MNGAALFRLLGDEARLRMLRLLADERLNVTELTSILGLAQSGVSRHLGLLKEAGFVEERREAGYTFYRLADAVRSGSNGFGPVWPLLQSQFDAAAATPEGRADSTRLEEVRRIRKESFDEHLDPDSGGRQLVPGRSWAAWARALAHLLPPVIVADLGCGEGYLTLEAAAFAKTVVGVDRSPAMIERARALAKRRRVANVAWKVGALEQLPIEDGSIDVALLSQALHHAEDPARALGEASRILREGGKVLVMDLRRHDERWVTELGDRWLGFDDEELATLLTGAGFTDIKVTVGARRAGDPFTVLIASGVKVAARSSKDPSND